MRYTAPVVLLVVGFALIAVGMPTFAAAGSSAPTFDVTTLAGKVASVRATDGLYLRVSAFLEDEADAADAVAAPGPLTPITPTYVLSSPLDGTSVAAPAVTVNVDTAGAPQNEPAIAVDPNNPMRIVVGSNDYASRTWTCTAGGTPCSALGDAYSGTYYSNDGGATWCCTSSDPSNLGTIIPGVERLTGGQYDAGGDPSLAFDSQGHVYFAGLGFDRTAPPNTVAVNKGTFDGSGALTWGPPTFIGQTTAPSTLNDKEWIGVDTHAGSPFLDRVYVSWTRFLFNPHNGRYIQGPIMFAFSSDGGSTFSDGPLADIIPPFNTAFRVNSFPAADIAPDGTLYAAWSSEVKNDATTYGADPVCAFFYSGTASVYTNCHSSAVWSQSTDGGATWSTPVPILSTLDGSMRTATGYPVTQPDGTTLNAPTARRVDSFWPAVGVTPSGKVYMSAYAADVVSPWQTCKTPASPTAVGRINCLALGNYVHNARLDYVVTDLTTAVTQTVTTNPINSRHGFGGGFIGDYTSLAVGSDNAFHAVWTDTNNRQSVTWWFGFEFVPTTISQQDIVTASGTF